MEHTHMVMDQQIFKMGLTVEATSVYIIIASLVTDAATPSLDAIRDRWTSDEASLEKSLAELMDRSIIEYRSAGDNRSFYHPNPASMWR